MKKLISAQSVKQAHKDGLKEIHAPLSTTIVTAEARTVAEKLGVRISDMIKPAAVKAKKMDSEEPPVEMIVSKVREKIPGNKYSDDQIRQAVIDVLSKL